MKQLQGRDLLSIADLTSDELYYLLHLASEFKSGKLSIQCKKVLGLLFYKASTRTRVSFSVAMYQLGGQVMDLNPSVTQVVRGEPIQDTARVLDRYLDILAVRTFKQEDLETFAQYAQIPIINALSDLEHPCQILADFMTIEENFGQLKDITLTYLGDGNNVAHSLIIGGALVGMKIRIATPVGYEPLPSVVEKARKIGGDITITNNALEAIEGSQVLYTDVWASMGQEDLANDRIPIFQPYQINDEALAVSDSQAIVLHCLPAHRGEEITEEVMECQQSKIWDQAENRMHAQKALLSSLLGLS